MGAEGWYLKWKYHSGDSKAHKVVVVELLNCVWLLATPWTAACRGSLSFTVSQSLLKVMIIESVISCNHLILCLPLLLLHSIFPSIGVFSCGSAPCIRWPKYWSFSFSAPVLPMNIELISFRTDWFDILVVQGTLKKRLLQHHSSKVSVLWHSVFFISFYWNI